MEKSKKVNADAIAKGRCTILQGSVAKRIFAEDWFDAVTAFETVYFWQELPLCFRDEDYRRDDHLQGCRAESGSGTGGLSRRADTQE